MNDIKKKKWKRRVKRMTQITAVGVIGLFMIIALYALSWIVCCGTIKLVTLCFGWTFSWRLATGLWIISCILRSIFKSNVTVNK